MYKTVVIEYSPKADNMAQRVEEKANEMLKDGYELVTLTETTTALNGLEVAVLTTQINL